MQEYTAPYTPEQNGLCERLIRSFKEECAWIISFTSITTITDAPIRRPATSPLTDTTKNYVPSQPD